MGVETVKTPILVRVGISWGEKNEVRSDGAEWDPKNVLPYL